MVVFVSRPKPRPPRVTPLFLSDAANLRRAVPSRLATWLTRSSLCNSTSPYTHKLVKCLNDYMWCTGTPVPWTDSRGSMQPRSPSTRTPSATIALGVRVEPSVKLGAVSSALALRNRAALAVQRNHCQVQHQCCLHIDHTANDNKRHITCFLIVASVGRQRRVQICPTRSAIRLEQTHKADATLDGTDLQCWLTALGTCQASRQC